MKLPVGKNTWTVKNKEIAYTNTWISVIHHNVLTPAQTVGVYGVVHFKNNAVGIIPLDEDGNIWMVGQFRFPLNEYTWEIPEGGSPLEIDNLSCAKRELLEETGIKAKKWTSLFQNIHLSNSISDEKGELFLAEELSFHQSNTEDTEDLMIQKVHIREAYQLVLDSKINDSLSIIGILRVWELYKNR